MVLPLVAAVVVAVAVIVTNVVDFEDGFSSSVLNANLSASWSHRATAGLLAIGTVIALLRSTRRDHRRLWTLSAAVLLVLFVAEASPAHVEVDRIDYGKLIYLPLLIALAIAVGRLAVGRPSLALAAAGGLTLAVAYFIHVFGLHIVELLGWGPQSLAYQLKVGVKQGTELAGWLLLVLALWRLARAAPSATPDRRALDDRLGRGRKLAEWEIGSPRERA